jgi:hypothetical protein
VWYFLMTALPDSDRGHGTQIHRNGTIYCNIQYGISPGQCTNILHRDPTRL